MNSSEFYMQIGWGFFFFTAIYLNIILLSSENSVILYLIDSASYVSMEVQRAKKEMLLNHNRRHRRASDFSEKNITH